MSLLGITLLLLLFSSSASAKSKISVTLPPSATQGQALTISGKVSAVRRAVRVRIESDSGNGWQQLARGKSDKKGRFTLTPTMPLVATIKLRVVAQVGGKTVRSKAVGLTLAASNNGNGNDNSNNNSAPLFTPPGKDMTGEEAAKFIVPYLTNSTFTDCVGGWPSCAVEQRYGHFASGEMYYCRLTGSGSQIINAPFPYQIIGADVKASGAWAVNIQANAYGNTVYYAWQVDVNGLAYGAYWNSSNSIYDNPGNPTERMGPLRWVRGARSCDS